MGRVGDEDVFPGVAAGFEGGPDEHHAGQLAVGAGRRLEGEGVHAGDLAEVALERLHDLQAPLDEVGRGERVRGRERGEGRQALVDLGVVLHRA